MNQRKLRQHYVFLLLAVCLLAVFPGKSVRAAERVFDIVVKDGYTTQTIPMLYGETPYGYTGYFAKESVILVNPKSKKVRFSVKNESSRYGNFSFQYSTLKPTEEPTLNMLSYYADGRRRAFLFSVRKIKAPSFKSFRLYLNGGKASNQFEPGKGKYLVAKWAAEYDVEPSMKLEILDRKGRRILTKEYARAKNYNGCVFKWKGYPARGNEAGMSASTTVKPGVYTLKITLTSRIGRKSLSAEQTRRFRVLKNT